MAKSSKRISTEWSQRKTLLATVTVGLLHDIEHGAFSHTFEVLFNKSRRIYLQIICDKSLKSTKYWKVTNGFAKQVAGVIAHKSEHKDVTDLISSQLDADRMDYLLQELSFTGANWHVDKAVSFAVCS